MTASFIRFYDVYAGEVHRGGLDRESALLDSGVSRDHYRSGMVFSPSVIHVFTADASNVS